MHARTALAAALVLAALVPATLASASREPIAAKAGVSVTRHGKVNLWTIHYNAHNRVARSATLVLPSSYGPKFHPPLPLIISPHGRGLSGRRNSAIWGQLPAVGNFAVVNPDGQGRLLGNYSWGSEGQVDDLARMPQIVRDALPWLQIDRKRIYAFGGSMGGQEALLLVARHPRLLAGAAAFDAVTDFRLQYHEFPNLRCDSACTKIWEGPLGRSLQSLARIEIGGPPERFPGAWARRSPITYARQIADSCVPLQLWWSEADRIVIGQRRQSGRFFWRLRNANRTAPVAAYVGFWVHSHEMQAATKLPYALAQFGLLPESYNQRGTALHFVAAPTAFCRR